MTWRTQWSLAVLVMLPVPMLAQGVKSEDLVGTWGRTYAEPKVVIVKGGPTPETRTDTVTVNDTLVINADGTMRRTYLENGKPQNDIVTRFKWSYVSDTLWATYGANKCCKNSSTVKLDEDGRKMTLGGQRSLAWNDKPYTRIGR